MCQKMQRFNWLKSAISNPVLSPNSVDCEMVSPQNLNRFRSAEPVDFTYIVYYLTWSIYTYIPNVTMARPFNSKRKCTGPECTV